MSTVSEEVGLRPEDLQEAAQNNPPAQFRWVLRYPTLPSIPEPVLENGLAVAWDIATTMISQGVMHTITERYLCAENERMSPTDPETGRLLERAMLSLEKERNIMARCADELEAKIAALEQ